MSRDFHLPMAIDNNRRVYSLVTDKITQVAGTLIKAGFSAKYSNWRAHALPRNLICFPFDGGPQIDPDDIAIRVLVPDQRRREAIRGLCTHVGCIYEY